jgi:DNA-binding transcriptional MerR regulator
MATVSRLSGFKPDLLRAWESRHQLLTPARGRGGQRLYSDQDLAVLQGVRALLTDGRSIGEIARLGRRHLAELSRGAATETNGTGEASDLPEAILPSVRITPQLVRQRGWTQPLRGDVASPSALQIAMHALARLSARLDATPLMQLICDTVASDFQAALARIWVIEPRPQSRAVGSQPPRRAILRLRASAGLSRQTSKAEHARIDLRTTRFKVGVVARSGQPFVSSSLAGDHDFDQRWVQKERLAAAAVLPIANDEALYGVLAAFFRVALNDELSGALRLFTTVAAGSLSA